MGKKNKQSKAINQACLYFLRKSGVRLFSLNGRQFQCEIFRAGESGRDYPILLFTYNPHGEDLPLHEQNKLLRVHIQSFFFYIHKFTYEFLSYDEEMLCDLRERILGTYSEFLQEAEMVRQKDLELAKEEERRLEEIRKSFLGE